MDGSPGLLSKSSRALFWQGLFIIIFKIGRNTTSQHFILANFYAIGVPYSAIHVFSKYFVLLKRNFTPASPAKFDSSIDKMGSNDRKRSLE